MAATTTIRIDGDDLEELLTMLAKGGYTGTGTHDLQIEMFPLTGKVSFLINHETVVTPMGEHVSMVRA